jgi:hypothetical protein
MVFLEITMEQALVLRELLGPRLIELRKEIAHTDHREYRDRLRRQAAQVEALLIRLAEADAPERVHFG